jgi:predicted outer membrane protein
MSGKKTLKAVKNFSENLMDNLKKLDPLVLEAISEKGLRIDVKKNAPKTKKEEKKEIEIEIVNEEEEEEYDEEEEDEEEEVEEEVEEENKKEDEEEKNQKFIQDIVKNFHMLINQRMENLFNLKLRNKKFSTTETIRHLLTLCLHELSVETPASLETVYLFENVVFPSILQANNNINQLHELCEHLQDKEKAKKKQLEALEKF